jgi:hypothetical protein
MASVVRIRRKNNVIVQDCDIYIGRSCYMGGWNLPKSKWANPYTVKEYGSLDTVITKYREYVKSKPELMTSLHELKGKRLGCWCHPNPCHGDVLLELLNEQEVKSNE